MEKAKQFFDSLLGSFKKAFFLLVIGVMGLLLTLAGVNLITLSDTLILYSGIILLITAGLYYLLS